MLSLLHYIDKKILSIPEEDCELDKVYVGLQLELKSEEDPAFVETLHTHQRRPNFFCHTGK